MLHLDDLDVRLLREFNSPGTPQWNVRESFTAVARRLGVDEETVRLRVRRLRERGVLPALRLAVNPRLLGCEETGFDLEVEEGSTKAAALARLRRLPGVTQIADFRGAGLLAIRWHEPGDAGGSLRAALDPIGPWSLRASWTSPFPEPTVRMRAVDWRILAAMREDARKDLRDVAAALGTTVRTVHRRLSALADGRAAFVVAQPTVDRVVGLLGNYLVYCPDRAAKRAGDAALSRSFPRIGMCDTDPEQFTVLGIACENLARAEEALTQLRAIYGVVTVRLAIVREIFRVDDWLEARLAAHGRVPPSALSRGRSREVARRN